MNTEFRIHDVVALLDEVPTRHFATGERLILRRGQIGTVVMTYDGPACEVEFAESEGRAYTMLPIPAAQLMRLRDMPEFAAA
jgi:hypothetical protein